MHFRKKKCEKSSMLDIYAVNTTEKGLKNRITLSLRPFLFYKN